MGLAVLRLGRLALGVGDERLQRLGFVPDYAIRKHVTCEAAALVLLAALGKP